MATQITGFRAWRQHMGITQKEAAHELGISYRMACRYDQGSHDTPLPVRRLMSQLYVLRPKRLEDWPLDGDPLATQKVNWPLPSSQVVTVTAANGQLAIDDKQVAKVATPPKRRWLHALYWMLPL